MYFNWEVWSFRACLCFNKLFWVDIIGVLGIVKTPPTKAPLVVSGDKCWSGCIPVIFGAAPMEGCPEIFSVYCDEFYCTVFLLRSWAPFFIFWPPISFPQTFLANQPLISHLPSSHMVPRSTTYPPGLPRYPSSLLATPNPVIQPIGNFTVISLLFSILRP